MTNDDKVKVQVYAKDASLTYELASTKSVEFCIEAIIKPVEVKETKKGEVLKITKKVDNQINSLAENTLDQLKKMGVIQSQSEDEEESESEDEVKEEVVQTQSRKIIRTKKASNNESLIEQRASSKVTKVISATQPAKPRRGKSKA